MAKGTPNTVEGFPAFYLDRVDGGTPSCPRLGLRRCLSRHLREYHDHDRQQGVCSHFISSGTHVVPRIDYESAWLITILFGGRKQLWTD
jgi:hypothetical protein